MKADFLHIAGRNLQQESDVLGSYVEAQIAILTSGNMATSLQVQLMATVTSPQGLSMTLQQNGLAVTSVALQSLDVEQVIRPSQLHKATSSVAHSDQGSSNCMFPCHDMKTHSMSGCKCLLSHLPVATA